MQANNTQRVASDDDAPVRVEGDARMPEGGARAAGALDAAEDGRVREALAHAGALLVPGETILAHAVQRRLFALSHRRGLVVATSGRFIGIARDLISGFQPTDVRWQDLQDVQLKVGVFGADLTLRALSAPDLAIAGGTRTLSFVGLRKDQAQAVYRVCQAQEQAWREKRRVRELEELRAKSGGVQIGAGLGAAPGSNERDPVRRLEQAKDMLARGLISDAEYESLKARIITNF